MSGPVDANSGSNLNMAQPLAPSHTRRPTSLPERLTFMMLFFISYALSVFASPVERVGEHVVFQVVKVSKLAGVAQEREQGPEGYVPAAVLEAVDGEHAHSTSIAQLLFGETAADSVLSELLSKFRQQFGV